MEKKLREHPVRYQKKVHGAYTPPRKEDKRDLDYWMNEYAKTQCGYCATGVRLVSMGPERPSYHRRQTNNTVYHDECGANEARSFVAWLKRQGVEL